MHARTTHSSSASVEAEEGNPNSESSRKSKDRMSEEKKKRKNPSGVNTHEDIDANGELDSPAADEPAANEGTSSPAPPPISESSENPRT